ncbi:hypothetical protein OUZ56_020149 [Daphnia magna]|uniref:Uncharacterized protein n=1 Tax=Daphnia magna TaxID=35525 RepID=A0ABQ9ZDY8_9CRUS|nr:hypothetical protein OUZ56_020149 [Daphnia magna]
MTKTANSDRSIPLAGVMVEVGVSPRFYPKSPEVDDKGGRCWSPQRDRNSRQSLCVQVVGYDYWLCEWPQAKSCSRLMGECPQRNSGERGLQRRAGLFLKPA